MIQLGHECGQQRNSGDAGEFCMYLKHIESDTKLNFKLNRTPHVLCTCNYTHQWCQSTDTPWSSLLHHCSKDRTSSIGVSKTRLSAEVIHWYMYYHIYHNLNTQKGSLLHYLTLRKQSWPSVSELCDEGHVLNDFLSSIGKGSFHFSFDQLLVLLTLVLTPSSRLDTPCPHSPPPPVLRTRALRRGPDSLNMWVRLPEGRWEPVRCRPDLTLIHHSEP